MTYAYRTIEIACHKAAAAGASGQYRAIAALRDKAYRELQNGKARRTA